MSEAYEATISAATLDEVFAQICALPKKLVFIIDEIEQL
ncbi:MAG: hypothetical protein RI894_2101, partial [Bacteroidota bacterium]